MRTRSRRTTAILIGTTFALAAGAVTTAAAFITTQATGRTEALVALPGDVTADDVSAPVAAQGLYPGAAPLLTTLHLENPQGFRYTLTAIEPDTIHFPERCPAEAWIVSVPKPLPELGPHATVDLVVGLSLSDSAPASCQGVHASLPLTLTGRYS